MKFELVSALAERLELRGIDASWADSGAKAMEMAKKEKYDVAVLDMKMPKMCGLELRRKLSEISPDTKYIFLSGHGSEDDFRKGSAEADSYLIKPVQLEELLAKINQITV